MAADPRPPAKDPSVRARMQAQRRKDTQPELALRKALHALGFRFRVNYPVPGSARRTIDIAFTKQKVAMFIDGCFWHGCPKHGVRPKNNAEWWDRKLAGNKARDHETTDILEQNGWRVIRIWECAELPDALQGVITNLR